MFCLSSMVSEWMGIQYFEWWMPNFARFYRAASHFIYWTNRNKLPTALKAIAKSCTIGLAFNFTVMSLHIFIHTFSPHILFIEPMVTNFPLYSKQLQKVVQLDSHFSRVDTDVELEVAYSCNIFAVPDSLTCPDIQTSWCHSGIIEHFEIRGFKMTP